MTSAAEACLLIKWREVASLSLRNYCSLREVSEFVKIQISIKIIAKKFGSFENYSYLCNIVAKPVKQLFRTKENDIRRRTHDIIKHFKLMSKIIYDVYQNKNTNNAAYGKYFGRIVHTETLNTRKLAKHIAEHGSVYTEDVVSGVLTKAEACIIEMLLESKKIKLEGLGTFYLMAENKKGGAVSIDKFNPKGSFKGLHIRFLPDLSGEAGLNSKDVLSKATFMWAEDLKRDKAEGRPDNPTNGGSTGGGSETGGGGNDDNNNDAPPVINPDTDHPSDGD